MLGESTIFPVDIDALAGRLAAVFNMDVEDVAERIRAGIRGEPEAAEMIGLTLHYRYMASRTPGWESMRYHDQMRARWAVMQEQASAWSAS